jgi:3-deoxy-7-phosphoheptulonate synthase
MDVKAQYPLKAEYAEKKKIRDAEIADVFTGKSNKLILIIGPCSADREDSVLDYISRLARLQEKVEKEILIIPRIYTNKPRTTGDGYKGMVHQPNPNAKEDMLEGIIAIRRLHTRAIEETGLFCAD